MKSPVTLPKTLLKRLEKVSATSRKSQESIVRQAVKERLDYEEWLAEQVNAGLAELKAGKGIPHDEFMKRIGVSTNARKKAA